MLRMTDIIREGHPTLYLKAKEVSFPLTDDHKQIAHDMLEFLKNSQDPQLADQYNLRPGVGIAAPQINRSERFFAVHLPGEDAPELSEVMFNPIIISHSIRQACLSDGEGCLSVDRQVPGIVPRHHIITVQYTDLDGQQQTKKLRGYPAIVVQHEMDHLNGVMFYDYINYDDPFALPEGIRVIGHDNDI